jgi:hypothetical protein
LKKLVQNEYVVVALLYLLFQVIWFAVFGVHFELEADKYINEAKYFLQHRGLSETRYVFYFSTIAVIAASFTVGIGVYGALGFIMVLNGLGYLYFFKALKKLFTDHLSPYLVIAALLSFWPYQSWSLYLYTECLFYTIVLVLFSYLILYRRLSARWCAGLVALLLLLVISRPLGILFILPALGFVFFKLSPRQKYFFYAGVVVFLLLLNYVVQVVFTTTWDWNMARAVSENSIICDMPRPQAGTMLDLSTHPNQLYQLWYFVTHNFGHFAGLAGTRLRFFFLLVRDYYSAAHNAYLLGSLAVLYGSVIFGIRQIFRALPSSLLLFIFLSFFFFAATIALQCDDFHNRFFLTLTPFLVTMSLLVLLPLLYRLPFFSARRKG